MNRHSDFTGQSSAVMARLVRVLHTDFVGTKAQIAAKCFCSSRTLDRYLARLHDVGLCRIVDWVTLVGQGASLVGIYGFGPGEHAERPRKENEKPRLEYSSAARDIIAYLKKHKRASMQQIAAGTGYAHVYCMRIMRILRDDKQARISGYDYPIPYHTAPIPLYSAGNGEDVPPLEMPPLPERNIRRRTALKKKYGAEMAAEILRPRRCGGPERIVRVVDGEKIEWTRKQPRGKQSKAAA